MKNTIKSIAMIALSATGKLALSHDGHALTGTHWHATDTWGFVAVAVALGAALWLSRGGK
jgi:hypothetical protein